MRRSACLVAFCLVAGLGLAACRDGFEASTDETAAIEALLDDYLPRLALAYSDGDASVLEGYAAQKEVAGMEKRIHDLLMESRYLRPNLESYKIEDVTIWSHANAFVTTIEVWDVQSLASGTDTVLAETLDESYRVKYQMKRSGDSWRVLFREIDAVF